MNLYTHTLPETNLAPEIGLPNRKVVFQPSIFRGYVSFREGTSTVPGWYMSLLVGLPSQGPMGKVPPNEFQKQRSSKDDRSRAKRLGDRYNTRTYFK